MVINFTKKALLDYSFVTLMLFYDVKGEPRARKLTTATMADNSDSSEESDVSLNVSQSLSEREKTVTEEGSQQSSDGGAQVLRRADSHPILYFCRIPEHGRSQLG
ncbi:hypothetical protein ATANTOWER_017040 [Ataeniobius toweri]|uniref:Uncharacterized protein n=1 Tax=Ataeniobius toweri TaxID=208326 RepID=A0ABU7C8N9_9TELE|nr:hypothetical protein [Ataeniobius toweri]